MRGWDAKSEALFSYVSCEARVPKDHPLRPIRRIVDEALAALSPAVAGLRFGALGAAVDGAARLQFAVPLVCRAVAG
jgi:hypothetical protein